MKITPIFKKKVLNLPFEIISEKLPAASKDELKVILAVFTEEEFNVPTLAAKLDMTENAFRRALKFWVENKALTVDESSDASSSSPRKSNEKKTEREQKRKIVVHTSLPHYTSDETAQVIEKTNGCSELLDSCQQILGKMFNSAETEIIIGLIDHLSLPHDYILLLCHHASNMDKRNVRYVEKMAIDFFDRDILTYSALEAELKLIEGHSSFERFIRKMFGIGSRSLIKKEREIISTWYDTYGFSNEIITRAYEITVAKTKEPSINYANAILEKWFAAGYKTLDEIDEAEKSYAKAKAGNSSFSVDDIYEAALMRSYNENK